MTLPPGNRVYVVPPLIVYGFAPNRVLQQFLALLSILHGTHHAVGALSGEYSIIGNDKIRNPGEGMESRR